MVTHVGAAKGMIALINGGQDCASTTVRKLMSQHIYGIIEHHRPDRVLRLQRDVLDRVIRTVAQLLSDADAGARSARLESYLLRYCLLWLGSMLVQACNILPLKRSLMG